VVTIAATAYPPFTKPMPKPPRGGVPARPQRLETRGSTVKKQHRRESAICVNVC
jgi:hypothetical protein